MTAKLGSDCLEHRLGIASKFTPRYNLHRLVHYEAFDEIIHAIAREKHEKQLKVWRGDGKIELVEKGDPDWHVLSGAWWALSGGATLQTTSS